MDEDVWRVGYPHGTTHEATPENALLQLEAHPFCYLEIWNGICWELVWNGAVEFEGVAP